MLIASVVRDILSATRERMANRRVIRTLSSGTSTVFLPSFRLDVRLGPAAGRLTVGEQAVIGCTVTLEREEGLVAVGSRTFVSPGTHIVCARSVAIGSDVLVAWGCTILDHDAHCLGWADRRGDVADWKAGYLAGGYTGAARAKRWDGVRCTPVHIGDKSWIGMGCIVLAGASIGEGAIVGAGSVVVGDIPSWTVAAGNPAKVVKDIAH